jgi:probable rRNA maturation factor
MPPGPPSSGSGRRKFGPPKKGSDGSASPELRVPEIRPNLFFRGITATSPLSKGARAKLRRFASSLNLEVAAGKGFDCLITNGPKVQSLNRTFLDHDEPTDVLSFPSDSKHGILGELAVSVDSASAQATEFGHPLVEELQILMLHGVLHLLGHDHERDRGHMARKEEELRLRYGLPTALIHRSQVETRSARKASAHIKPARGPR